MSRVRAWVFTSYAEVKPELKPCMRVLMFAHEECPDTGRMHWQGAVCFKNAKTLKAAKRAVGGNPHMQTMKGTWEHQVAYIKGPFEDGDKKKEENETYECLPDEDAIPRQGKRTDLKKMAEEIMEGKSVDEMCVENPMAFHQYGRTLSRLEDIRNNRKKRNFMTKGIWLWGPTGTGKSWAAHHNYGDDKWVMPKDDHGWCDTYEGQEVVIIDDFRAHLKYDALLTLVDENEHVLSRRGRQPRQFVSKIVVITCSMPPEELYNHRRDMDDIAQLRRRFVVIQMNDVYSD